MGRFWCVCVCVLVNKKNLTSSITVTQEVVKQTRFADGMGCAKDRYQVQNGHRESEKTPNMRETNPDKQQRRKQDVRKSGHEKA